MDIPLHKAEGYAQKVIAAIAPYCERIDVAGSIRRRRRVVHDIDLVVSTRDSQALRRRCRKACSVIADGRQNFRLRTRSDIQIEIYFADVQPPDLFEDTPSNFGSLLLCRTGSKEHNIYLVQHAKTLGMRWAPYAGVYDSGFNLIASETEEDIFAALQLEYIEPEERER